MKLVETENPKVVCLSRGIALVVTSFCIMAGRQPGSSLAQWCSLERTDGLC